MESPDSASIPVSWVSFLCKTAGFHGGEQKNPQAALKSPLLFRRIQYSMKEGSVDEVHGAARIILVKDYAQTAEGHGADGKVLKKNGKYSDFYDRLFQLPYDSIIGKKVSFRYVGEPRVITPAPGLTPGGVQCSYRG